MSFNRWFHLLIAVVWMGQLTNAQNIQGVDISEYNGSLNWTQLAGQGVRFAWMRSTLGVGIDDAKYAVNATNAQAAGVVTGAYHFCYPVYTGGSNTAVAEAQWFVSRAGAQIGLGHLPPALDVENDNGEDPVLSSMSTAELSDWVLTWCREVQRLTGVKPIIYMSSNFANNEVDSRVAAEFPLWIANYGANDSVLDLTRSVETGPWPTWKFWQYSSRGVLTGNGSTYIDRNVFSGNEADFQSLIGIPPATEAMLALNRMSPQVMGNISTPDALTSHYEARIMVRRILENFLGTSLTPTQLTAISSAVPFDDPTVRSEPVLRQEVFAMLTGALEGVKGFSRPVESPPNVADLPVSGWERNAILGAFAWQIVDSDDLFSGIIQPSSPVSRSQFATWAVKMMDVLLNSPVNSATEDMRALNATNPTVMSDISNPNRYTSHYEARIMVRKTLEVALSRSLTPAELLGISVADPFDDATIGNRPVVRREVFQMILGGLENVAKQVRPASVGILIEDMPTSGWQVNTIAGCNSWGIFDTADTPSSEIYESARVSRYSFAKWDRKILTLLGTPTPGTFNQWMVDAGFSGVDAAATADPDHDGLNNAVEMVLGGNPASGMNAVLCPTGGRITNPGGAIPVGNYLLFTYRRTDASVAGGVVSGVEFDADMTGSWTQAVNGVSGVRIVETNDGFGSGVDQVQVYVPQATNAKVFARLKVTVP